MLDHVIVTVSDFTRRFTRRLSSRSGSQIFWTRGPALVQATYCVFLCLCGVLRKRKPPFRHFNEKRIYAAKYELPPPSECIQPRSRVTDLSWAGALPFPFSTRLANVQVLDFGRR